MVTPQGIRALDHRAGDGVRGARCDRVMDNAVDLRSNSPTLMDHTGKPWSRGIGTAVDLLSWRVAGTTRLNFPHSVRHGEVLHAAPR